MEGLRLGVVIFNMVSKKKICVITTRGG